MRKDKKMKNASTSTITVERVTPKIVKVRFANPPVNLIFPETVTRLHEVVKELSEDEKVHVVIFTSGVADYFYNHFDLTRMSAFPDGSEASGGSQASEANGKSVWTDLVIRLSKAPFISIGAIRGRTRGGGNELSLAFDLRYASREKAFFGQPEVGSGVIPGGGGSERLPRLIGRDRALEVILSSEDYNADIAEHYGWVTRAIADKDLDSFVDGMASRLASFDKTAMSAAKKQINRATLPPDADLQAAYTEFLASLSFPGFKPRAAKILKFLTDLGVHDIEKRLGHYIGIASKF
jgi:enoyl-CoA hydratase/carnithine racemase